MVNDTLVNGRYQQPYFKVNTALQHVWSLVRVSVPNYIIKYSSYSTLAQSILHNLGPRKGVGISESRLCYFLTCICGCSNDPDSVLYLNYTHLPCFVTASYRLLWVHTSPSVYLYTAVGHVLSLQYMPYLPLS